jgi:hypothetical protein
VRAASELVIATSSTLRRADTKKTRETRAQNELQHSQAISSSTYCCCRRSSSPAKSRREAPPSPQISNPVVEKAPSRRAEPDEQLEFQGGELR